MMSWSMAARQVGETKERKRGRYVVGHLDRDRSIDLNCVHRKQLKSQAYDYIEELHSAEYDNETAAAGIQPAVRYGVTLVPAAATNEGFALYKRYQATIITMDRERTICRIRQILVPKSFVCGSFHSRQYDILLNAESAYSLRQKQRILYPTLDTVSPDLPLHYGLFHQRESTHARTAETV